MTNTSPQIEEFSSHEFNLVNGGPATELAKRLGLAGTTATRRVLKIFVLWVITWVPLGVLSMTSGRAVGIDVAVPFLHDPEVHSRLLIVMPLLEIAQVIVAASLLMQVRHLRKIGILPARELPSFDATRADAHKLRTSPWSDLAILILAYTLAIVFRLFMGFSEGDVSWERTGAVLTAAGWWHMLISLPVVYFLLLRWCWVFFVWGVFLYRVSRLDLQLTPTHPDHTGGLGFLGWGLASFALVLMAVSVVFSAGFAAEILHRGESLNSLKYHLIVFVAIVLVVIHAPLLSFSARLSQCRFRGLLDFGALAWRHDTAFDDKWIKNTPAPSQEAILGSSDVSSLANIAKSYEHVNEMWLFPFDTKAFAVLVASTLLPLLPLIGTEVPLKEIFLKLGEMLI